MHQPEPAAHPTHRAAQGYALMFLNPSDWQALVLSLQLAATTTALLFAAAIPLGWWLSQAHHPFSKLCETVLTLPLVLPPTVMGFYLLELMGPHRILGRWTQAIGLPIAPFSFGGLVFAMSLASLPFMLGPVRDAFRLVGRGPIEAAQTLGASPLTAFCTVALPLARPGLLSGCVMTFAHTLGEFGVVMMIGGNLPGETRVASVQLYDHVEALRTDEAHKLAAVLLALGFISLFVLQSLRRSGPAVGAAQDLSTRPWGHLVTRLFKSRHNKNLGHEHP